MPIIPPMALQGETVSSEDIYTSNGTDGGLFDPRQETKSLEALNGLLDPENLHSGGGIGNDDPLLIQPWMCQIGTFARGAYWGTDRWEYHFASQTAFKRYTTETPGNVTDDCYSGIRIPIAQLSQEVFLPWKPSFVLYGYQAWMRQDATNWDTGGAPKYEWWDAHVYVNGDRRDFLRVHLPNNRGSTATALHVDGTIGGAQDPGSGDEERYRWIEKSGMLSETTAVGPGHMTFRVELGATVYAPDAQKAGCVIPTCAAWLLALR